MRMILNRKLDRDGVACKIARSMFQFVTKLNQVVTLN